MPKPIKIFVEGIADAKFMADYLSHILPDLEIDKSIIIETGGWTNINSQSVKGEAIRNQMEENTDNGGVNLLIFDADGDFAARKQEITDWKKIYNRSFEIFLFPNDEDKGELEDLLEKIINPLNQPIFDCWQGYESCLKTTTIVGRDQPLTTPAIKTKIYAYLEALLGSSNKEKEKIKERERDYKNSVHWNLDSTKLDKLKLFLTQNIIK